MSRENEMINNYDYVMERISSQEKYFRRRQLLKTVHIASDCQFTCVSCELHDDFVWSHHLVVFVLEDVAVPDVEEFLSPGDTGAPWGRSKRMMMRVT